MGEPPPLVDPRRWGSLIGLIGGLVFIGSYFSALGDTLSTLARVAGVALVLAALFAHYVRPVSLGPLTRPRPLAVATYGACVVGELALIALGSRALTAGGHADLRPALIAAVVGLHFIPFAWAFGERMFFWLGGLVLVLGAVGLVAGAAGLAHAAEALAVVAGLGMLVIITLYAMGRFAPRLSTGPLGTVRRYVHWRCDVGRAGSTEVQISGQKTQAPREAGRFRGSSNLSGHLVDRS